jgi:hypothetical protein
METGSCRCKPSFRAPRGHGGVPTQSDLPQDTVAGQPEFRPYRIKADDKNLPRRKKEAEFLELHLFEFV